MITWMHLSESASALAALLLRSSLLGALFIAALWLLTRLAPRIPVAVRSALWWSACLKLVLGLIWTAPLGLPVLPPAAGGVPVPPAAGVAFGAASGASSGARLGVGGATQSAGLGGPAVPTGGASSWRETGLWALALCALWLAGMSLQMVRLRGGLARIRALVRASRPLLDADALALAATLAGRLGLRRLPALRRSPEISTPLTAGLLRPVVLLPESAAGLSPGELAMVLCHELLHVRRRDLWWGWLPALAQRIFFFHPLAALAAREYALAREAACDAEVLRTLAPAPRDYGKLLLKLTLAARPAGLVALGAAPAVETLKRRLAMLNDPRPMPRRARRLLPLLALFVFACMVPFQLVARRATAAGHPAFATGEVGEDEVIFLCGNHDSTVIASRWHGGDDLRHVKALRSKLGGGEVLWFRRGGKEYVVRDPATLQKVRELFAPQQELGRQQGELGARQGELGSRQGQLGAEQGKLGMEQGRVGVEQARLGLDEKDDPKLEQRERELEGKMEELSSKQEELGRQQEELGRQQEALGERQEKLGHLQEQASREAEAKLHTLVDQAPRLRHRPAGRLI